MPEPDLRAELRQPRPERGRRRLDGDSQPGGGPPHQQRITGGIGRRQCQQSLGPLGQALQLPPEALLDPARQRHRPRQPEPARKLGRRQPPRQLKQGQRVPPGLGDDQVSDPRVDRPGQRRCKQRARILLAQAGQRELRQPGQLRPVESGREHQPDRIGRQPPRHEPQRLHRRPVQPLLVIDHADQRPLGGHLREQSKHRQTDQEPVRRRTGAEAERDPQRVALRAGEPTGLVQHRRQQLMQPGERELHLRLHPGRPRYPAPRRPRGQVVEQRGLAHPGLTADHQHPADACPHGANELIERAAFHAAVRQPARAAARPGIVAHR